MRRSEPSLPAASVAYDATHEGASRALMRALADTGEHAQAVREYTRCRKALRKALDVEPSPETRALCEAIRSFTGCGRDKAAGPSNVSRHRDSSIPVPRTDQGRPRVDPMLVTNVSRNSATRRKGPRTMPVLNLATVDATPSPSQLIAQAEAMIPVLRQRAGDADRNARLAPETIRELREAGFFRILQPPRFAGYGMRPSVLWEVTRHLGRGCGSTAFLVSLLGVHAWIVGMFEPRAQAEVFHDGADTIASNLSIGVRRGNSVTRTEDGYNVTGKWGYASGIDFADWVISRDRSADRKRRPRGTDRACSGRQLLHRLRHLEGRGRAWDRQQGRLPSQCLRSRTIARSPGKTWSTASIPALLSTTACLYRLSAGSLFVLSSAAPVVAVACAAVNCFIDETKRRCRQVKQQWLQIELGSCASQIHMAHSLLIRDADEVFDWAAAGQDLSVDIQARHRADAAMIARTALSRGRRAVSRPGRQPAPGRKYCRARLPRHSRDGNALARAAGACMRTLRPRTPGAGRRLNVSTSASNFLLPRTGAAFGTCSAKRSRSSSIPPSILQPACAVTCLGLAKGGFIGFGLVATPLLALAVSPLQAAAILLPIMLLQDLISTWTYRRELGWMEHCGHPARRCPGYRHSVADCRLDCQFLRSSHSRTDRTGLCAQSLVRASIGRGRGQACGHSPASSGAQCRASPERLRMPAALRSFFMSCRSGWRS